MLDIKFIRENAELVKKAAGDKRIACDVDALADMLTYLIENPQRWPEMGRRGRALVEQHLTLRSSTINSWQCIRNCWTGHRLRQQS